MTEQAAQVEVTNGGTSSKAVAPKEGKRSLIDLRQEVDRVFERAFHGWPEFKHFGTDWKPFLGTQPFFGGEGFARFPQADVEESDKAYTISLEVPGVGEKDLELDVSDDMLTIKGEKKSEHEDKDNTHYLNERLFGRFERSFRIPDDVNATKISADFDKGVLSVNMPKRAAAKKKSRKIAIKAKR